MHDITFARRALGFIAGAVLLAGCGGGVGNAPMQTALLPPSSMLANAHTKRADSWMAPEATSEDLLYVSDADGVVDVLSYPDGKLVGVLKGFSSPAGLCSDAAGNVFVTDTNTLQILEYKHGAKKPMKAPLNDFGHYPFGCAVDPGTKNVAVANYASTLKLGPGSVSIFVGGKGEPHSYQNTAFNVYFFCSYDDKGNLFVDGADYGSYHTQFAELAKGSSTLNSITLDQTIGYPGGVQWDGKYIAVQDTYGHTIYRFSFNGSAGKSMGAVHIKGDKSGLLAQFWIDGNTVVVPYGTKPRETRSVGLWPYTGGGSPTKGFAVAHASELVGATVSLAKK